ncbi:MAG TPA: porin family protein [Longimicrobiales bacterium]|nr:porin family protein [Longimicrobiales bacterium]
MKLRRCWTAAMAALMAGSAGAAMPAAGQETGIKGGVSISRLQTDGAEYWDDNLVTSTFGGHARFRLGPLVLQPELLVVTKGASASQPFPADLEDDQIRMEYIEVPLMIVVPVSIGMVEPYVMGGPALMLESRCRSYVRQDGLRTNLPCDPPQGQLFRRTAFDYGVAAAGGVAYPVFGGRAFVEGRHTWGLRNIHKGPGDADVRNRTLSFLVGFAMGWDPAPQ